MVQFPCPFRCDNEKKLFPFSEQISNFVCKPSRMLPVYGDGAYVFQDQPQRKPEQFLFDQKAHRHLQPPECQPADPEIKHTCMRGHDNDSFFQPELPIHLNFPSAEPEQKTTELFHYAVNLLCKIKQITPDSCWLTTSVKKNSCNKQFLKSRNRSYYKYLLLILRTF